jgi:hypothetical protein
MFPFPLTPDFMTNFVLKDRKKTCYHEWNRNLEKRGRMARGGHGLHKALLGLAIPPSYALQAGHP